MRFSVNESDVGYQDYRALKNAGVQIEVFVDGELVNDVIAADDVQSYIIRNVRDSDGEVKIAGDSFAEETIRGKVEIRISQPKPVEADVDGE